MPRTHILPALIALTLLLSASAHAGPSGPPQIAAMKAAAAVVNQREHLHNAGKYDEVVTLFITDKQAEQKQIAARNAAAPDSAGAPMTESVQRNFIVESPAKIIIRYEYVQNGQQRRDALVMVNENGTWKFAEIKPY